VEQEVEATPAEEAPPAEEAAPDLKRPLEEAAEGAEGAAGADVEESTEAPAKKTRVSRFTTEPAEAPVPSAEAAAAAAAAEAGVLASSKPAVDGEKVQGLMDLAMGTKSDGPTAEMQCPASKVPSRAYPPPNTTPFRGAAIPWPANPCGLLPRRLTARALVLHCRLG
jgi:hypothetical protein